MAVEAKDGLLSSCQRQCRGRLTTKVIDALGNVTTHEYDGNGNLVKSTDADGFVTEYTYSALDLVENINYNGGKQVDYAYNKTGDLVEMTDWTGTTTFEVDLLHRITATTERLGQHVAYTYDEVGNQTSVSYPDGTTAIKEYDLVGNLTKVVEEDGRTTTYTYDGMARLTHMDYPDGWQEDYTYDAIGQLLSIYDTDPSGKDMKQQKNIFEYDDCGNMTYEYMRGNGTGESTVETFYTYDELHRVVSAKENYGNAWRSYVYDSLGNLTYEENSNNVHYDYKLNNLNQVTEKTYGTKDKERTVYTYDGRGNLILEEYAANNGNGNRSTVAEYTYDETNKMVRGENGSGESSSYFFNGLGALVQQTWVIAKNGYGYHDVQADEDDASILTADAGIALFANGNGNGNGQGNGNGSGDKPTGSDVKNTSTVVKQFVVDYTVETLDPLMEHEVNGLDYRYVYGFQNLRLSVNISPIDGGAGSIVETGTVGEQIRLYYHQDLRGTVDYLTSPVSQKVESWTHYNEWGEITHNAVVKCGYREFDLVKNYTGHEYDAVLNLYYAKARMYDAENRRFTSVDPILDVSRYDISEYVTNPRDLVQYLYVRNNPLIFVDPLGLHYITADGVRLRAEPGLDGAIIDSLYSGYEVTLLGEMKVAGKYTWAKVRYGNEVGWVATEYLTASKPQSAHVTANVNFRSGPGMTYSVYYILPPNTAVKDLGNRFDADGCTWAYVEYNGITGWVASHYLRSGTQQIIDTKKTPTKEPASKPVPATDVGLKSLLPSEFDPLDITYELAHALIANDIFAGATQAGWGKDWFYRAGFERKLYWSEAFNEYGYLYYSRYDAWQQLGGYNSVYDFIFDVATDMDAASFEFTSGGVDYVFWAWRGDYLNLGSGAELGIYTRLWDTEHWLVDKSLSLPMTIRLIDNKTGKTIFYRNPSDPQWWITGFYPNYQNAFVCNLTAIYTIDFSSNQAMFYDFKDHIEAIQRENRWDFDLDTYIATFVFS